STGVNVASFAASGYDIAARYRLDPADWGITANIGTFGFALNATKLESWSFQEDALSDPLTYVGEPGTPEWQAVFDATWMFGDFTLNYGYSWFSRTERFSDEALAANPNLVAPE